MRKEFYQDFTLKDEISKIEIISSKVDYSSLNRGNINLISNLKLTYLDDSNEKDFIICLDEYLPSISEDQYINIDVINLSYVFTCSRLTLFGEIEINILDKEEDEFKIDPFKESLLKSFINYKRNIEEVEMISTLNDEQINEEVIKEVVEIKEDEIIPYFEEKNKEEENYIELKLDEHFEVKKEKVEELVKDKYVSPYFYYRVGKNETINDIINKFNISLDDFKKYNNKSTYVENSLVKIVKNEK